MVTDLNSLDNKLITREKFYIYLGAITCIIFFIICVFQVAKAEGKRINAKERAKQKKREEQQKREEALDDAFEELNVNRSIPPEPMRCHSAPPPYSMPPPSYTSCVKEI